MPKNRGNGTSAGRTPFRRKTFEKMIITLQESPSICFWRHSCFVPACDSSKLDTAHLLYQQGFVVQFPWSTGSSEVFSNLNLTGPPKSQVFSAFEPVEQIAKLCSPAKNWPKPGFCSEKSQTNIFFIFSKKSFFQKKIFVWIIENIYWYEMMLRLV